MRMVTAAWVLAAWLMASTAGAQPAAPYHPVVGQRHVDFTLPEIRTGRPVSLSDFRGKRVLLIHFASW